MQYAYGYQLNGTQAGGLDPDAKAYINAVVAAGATVTSTQRTAINNFVKGEKAGSRWTLLKRLYLPIWGVAAPNAICMTSLTSGTFVGGVTHSSGYVTTNASTGHFLSDASPGQAGCTLNGSGVFALISAASPLTGVSLTTGTNICGASTSVSTTRTTLTGNSITTLFAGFGPNSSTFANYLTSGDRRGVVNFQRNSSADRFLSFRNSSGEVNTGLLANAAGSLNNTIPMAFMANNVNGAVSGYVPATVYNGAWGMTDGFDIAKSQLFTASLKTLWETCTGLALP
jgi:hypothetical protein